ncbi:hypothetical protein TBLA_0B01040 [Henningerozyma blattae CBS 6284]|uniref:Inactive metallocarboxypeptidase ECM14 n=1 Tax=Henningerozyma blattae (strain ATCC 34711 / CBS 6284 / DSM 70876 / NBRC 10599 / NRRL Y-10934 / UCD 77-7) TaxID=1071380 RepID=I2GXU5_HENB6|nr:hypothetical protein TBLA_0B01040 [Tetrapisispora blattae CBS 6284]CCH58947.1 hypothetical protein TBLA_0B01040 [Tetrapisispora blattae CBS 6284]
MNLLYTTLITLTLLTTIRCTKSYSHYKIIRCSKDFPLQRVDRDDYEIWSKNSKFIDLMVWKNQDFKECDLLIEDLDEAIKESYPKNEDHLQELYLNILNSPSDIDDKNQINFETFKMAPDLFFRNYRPLNVIDLWIRLLNNTFPELVTIERIGRTHEGRPLEAIHISSNNPELNPERKTIVITGGIHSREWVSISSVCYIMYQLLTRYGLKENEKLTRETNYLDSLDFLFIPVFNPDGYEYTWTTDRLWRKNRQLTPIEQCQGIDIDHSFNFHWETGNTSPCNEDYSGIEPMEAMEAYSLNQYLITKKKDYKVYGYIDFHSYSQEILYPYAYSCDSLPRDFENLLELSYGISRAIHLTTKKKYNVVAACEDRGSDILPGMGSGSALDFMYHNRAFWAFQIKLRDNGNYGFLLPAKFIESVGKDAYAAVKYFCEFILNPDL